MLAKARAATLAQREGGAGEGVGTGGGAGAGDAGAGGGLVWVDADGAVLAPFAAATMATLAVQHDLCVTGEVRLIVCAFLFI